MLIINILRLSTYILLCRTSIADTLSAWPDDDFALPETLFGCPEPDSDRWKQATVTLVISDNYLPEARHLWPEFPHVRSSLHRRNVSLNFCVKNSWEKSIGNDSNRHSGEFWPPGNYCFYKEHPCSEGRYWLMFELEFYLLKSKRTQKFA